MIRNGTKIILALSCLLAAVSYSASVPFGSDMMRFFPASLGDARVASQDEKSFAGSKHFEARLDHDTHEFTCTAWARISTAIHTLVTTSAFYSPDAFSMSNPDLAGNLYNFASGGLWQTGTVSIQNFEWQTYSSERLSERYPRGLYTLDGWTSNALTVALGGNAYSFAPGVVRRVIAPGQEDSFDVSVTGRVCIGISVCPAGQFFSNVDGVRALGSGLWTPESVITNEISFVSWRFRLDDTAHIYRSDLTRLDRCTMVGQTVTNAMPDSGARIFSKRGIYRVGFQEMGMPTPQTVELFDARLHMRWLSDDELCRVHMNGVTEIERRGIPRWR